MSYLYIRVIGNNVFPDVIIDVSILELDKQVPMYRVEFFLVIHIHGLMLFLHVI